MAGTDRKLQVLLAEDGDVIQFDERGARIADKAPAGRVLIDVTRIGEVGDEVLERSAPPRRRRRRRGRGRHQRPDRRARRRAGDGGPRLCRRRRRGRRLLRDAAGVVAECIAASSVEERTDQGLMTEKLRVELRRFFKKRSGRRPLVLPVLMEI